MGGHAWSLFQEQEAAEKAVTKEEFPGEGTAPAPEFTAAQPEVADWSEGVQVPSVPIQQFPTGMYVPRQGHQFAVDPEDSAL